METINVVELRDTLKNIEIKNKQKSIKIFWPLFIISIVISIYVYYSIVMKNIHYYFTSKSYYKQSIELKKQEKHNEAIDLISKAINFNSNESCFYSFRASEFLEIYKHDKALDDVDKALKLDPHNDYAFYMKGTINRIRGLNNEAIKNLDSAINIKPSYIYYFERSKAKVSKQDYIGAINDLKVAMNFENLEKELYEFYCLHKIAIYYNLDEKNKQLLKNDAEKDYKFIISYKPSDDFELLFLVACISLYKYNNAFGEELIINSIKINEKLIKKYPYNNGYITIYKEVLNMMIQKSLNDEAFINYFDIQKCRDIFNIIDHDLLYKLIIKIAIKNELQDEIYKEFGKDEKFNEYWNVAFGYKQGKWGFSTRKFILSLDFYPSDTKEVNNLNLDLHYVLKETGILDPSKLKGCSIEEKDFTNIILGFNDKVNAYVINIDCRKKENNYNKFYNALNKKYGITQQEYKDRNIYYYKLSKWIIGNTDIYLVECTEETIINENYTGYETGLFIIYLNRPIIKILNEINEKEMIEYENRKKSDEEIEIKEKQEKDKKEYESL